MAHFPQSMTHVETVLLAEAQRRQALLEEDWSALEALLADELTYVHSTGVRDTKASLLHKFRSGQIHYRSLTFEDLQPQAIGDGVLIMGRMLAEIEKEGQTRQVRSLFMTAWCWQADPLGDRCCRLLAHQGTALPT